MLIGLAFAVSAIDSSTHEEASNSEDVAVDDVVSQEELEVATEKRSILALKDKCGKNRRRVTFHFSTKGRHPIRLKQTKTIVANNGKRRKLKKGDKFFFCGCDKGGTCVIYGDGPPYANPDGTTFFGNVPSSMLGVKKGKTLFGKWRGASPLKSKPRKVVKRKIVSKNLNPAIVHGPDASIAEYTYLARGKFVTGAESPASYYKGKKKLGRGFNTGLFKPRTAFYDVCVQKLTTRVHLLNSFSSGKLSWVFGYSMSKGAKVWMWMIDGILIPGGNGKWKRGNVV